MKKNLSIWLITTFFTVFSITLVGQQWKSIGLDSIKVNSEFLTLISHSQYSIAFTDTLIGHYPNEVEFEGIIEFPSLSEEDAEAFLIFGTDSNNVKTLWAVGYSRLKKQIIVGTVNLNASDSLKQISLDVQRKKNVEIISLDKTIGMKVNFYVTSNILKIRVHGVPLEIEKPFSAKSVNLIGFLIYGGTFKLRKPIIRVR